MIGLMRLVPSSQPHGRSRQHFCAHCGHGGNVSEVGRPPRPTLAHLYFPGQAELVVRHMRIDPHSTVQLPQHLMVLPLGELS